MRLAAAVFVFFFGLLSMEAQAGSMVWLDSIEAGRAEAQRTGKLLLVHFMSTHCGPCVQLDRNVYSQSEVIDAISRHFVAVKINTELNPELARRHSIRFVPTDMVIDPSGRLLATQKCPPHPSRYVAGLMRLVPSAKPTDSAGGIRQSPVPQSVPAGYQNPSGYQNAVGPRYANQMPPTKPATPASTSSVSAPPSTGPAATGPPAMTPGLAPPSNPPAVKRPVTPWNAVSASKNLGKAPGATDEFGGLSEVFGSANGQVTQSAYLPSNSTLVRPAATSAEQVSLQKLPTRQPVPQSMPLPPVIESPSLDGMCPVALTEQKKWVVGDPQWGAYHRGRLYLFAGEAQQQRFLANPDHYSPVLSGYDPVVAFEQQQFKLGQRKHGVFFKNRIYLFASEENLKRFYQSPDRFNQAFVSP